MSTDSYRNNNKKKSPRYVGIGMDAEKLGVSRCHLWYVLTGVRRSPGLLQAYRELQEAKREAAGRVEIRYARPVRNGAGDPINQGA